METSVTLLLPRLGGGVRGCEDLSLIDIVGFGFGRCENEDFGALSAIVGSAMRRRASTQVGGLCSISESETHHEPGRLPDLTSQFSGATKKHNRHIRPDGISFNHMIVLHGFWNLLRAINSIVIDFVIIIRFWNLTIPKFTANEPSSSGRLITSTSSGGNVTPISISSATEPDVKSGDSLRRWNNGWSEATRQA